MAATKARKDRKRYEKNLIRAHNDLASITPEINWLADNAYAIASDGRERAMARLAELRSKESRIHARIAKWSGLLSSVHDRRPPSRHSAPAQLGLPLPSPPKRRRRRPRPPRVIG